MAAPSIFGLRLVGAILHETGGAQRVDDLVDLGDDDGDVVRVCRKVRHAGDDHVGAGRASRTRGGIDLCQNPANLHKQRKNQILLQKSVLYMGNPRTEKQNLMLADIDPERLLEGETSRLTDEWQLASKLWDTIVRSD